MNHWIFSFFLFCIVIPKKGIFYESTSTSFVRDCANKYDNNLNFLFKFVGPDVLFAGTICIKTKTE